MLLSTVDGGRHFLLGRGSGAPAGHGAAGGSTIEQTAGEPLSRHRLSPGPVPSATSCLLLLSALGPGARRGVAQDSTAPGA